ncbi:MAG: NUDIX domain-containing protein [Candidatus Woesebacteria bacterium]
MSEKTRRPQVGVGVMIIRNGKLLMGKRLGKLGFGTYGWLGGHIEHGETMKECAIREVLEETGITVKHLEFLSANSAFIGDKHYIDLEFIATKFSGTPKVVEPEKVESWDWYSLDNLPKPLFPPCEMALRCYFEKVSHIR